MKTGTEKNIPIKGSNTPMNSWICKDPTYIMDSWSTKTIKKIKTNSLKCFQLYLVIST
jgi:hypothetical protein